jgi:hypothetical protein
MPQLSARFSFPISAACLITWPETGTPGALHVAVEGLSVKVTLTLAEHWRTKPNSEADWTTSVAELEITVSGEEPDEPPPVLVSAEGKRDLTAQQAYLLKKLPRYKRIAIEVGNRVLTFFRYTLNTPNVVRISERDQAANQATWIDASGQDLPAPTAIFIVQPVPGLKGQLGVKKLTPDSFENLQAYVESPKDPSLPVSLLSEAQSAWFEGNLRRAVLELSICTEVVVKRRFFAHESPAGAAFDYLEDRSKIAVKVLDLIDAVAEAAFGISYKKAEPNRYRSIDYLFRCRNKIAHRGELSFRDDGARTIAVDATTVEEWWNAVAHLVSWINSLE